MTEILPGPERLAEIQARADAATPGPWTTCPIPNADKCACVVVDGDEGNYLIPNSGNQTREDAAFIAAAREDIPWLLDQVRALQAEVTAGVYIEDERNALQARQPMPLAEPPVGSRVRTGAPPWQEYERAEDGWRQAGGPLLRPDSRFKWVGDLERNVVAIGTPTVEWTEVER